MPITLKCFATLSAHRPADGDAMDIADGETVASVVNRLGIPKDAVSLVFVNNLRRDLDAVLKDGDTVGLFPKVGGG